MQETQDQPLGQEDSPETGTAALGWEEPLETGTAALGREEPLETGTAACSSVLAWRIPRTSASSAAVFSPLFILRIILSF